MDNSNNTNQIEERAIVENNGEDKDELTIVQSNSTDNKSLKRSILRNKCIELGNSSIRKGYTKNLQVKFVDDMYVSKQPTDSKIKIVQKTRHEISKTQARKGREKLSKNNFITLPSGEVDRSEILQCHTFCTPTMNFYLRMYRRLFEELNNKCEEYYGENLKRCTEDNIREIEVYHRLKSIYSEHLDFYEYPTNFNKIVDEVLNQNICKSHLFIEYEHLRKCFESDYHYLHKDSGLKKCFQRIYDEIMSIKIYTTAALSYHAICSRMKGIPKPEYAKWKEEEIEFKTRKYYLRLLKEIFYSLKIRWETNSITKHPILSCKFNDIKDEIFNRPIEEIYDAIMDLQVRIKNEPNPRKDWFEQRKLNLHANVYDRVRDVFTKEEILKIDSILIKFFVSYPMVLPVLFALMHVIFAIYGVGTTYVYVMYCSILLRFFLYFIFNYLNENVETLIMHIGQKIGSGLSKIGRSVHSKCGIFDTLVHGFNNHKAGLSACVYDIAQADTPSKVVSEVVKIGSMLQLETSVTNSMLGKLTQNVGDRLTNATTNQVLQQHMSPEKILPALSVALGVAGKSLSDFKLDQNINMMAMNLKNSQFLYKSITDILKEAGFMRDSAAELVIDLTTKLTEIRKDYEWILKCLATSGNEFLKPEGSLRYKNFKKVVDDITLQMREIEKHKFEKTQILTEANTLLVEIRRNIDAVEVILKRLPRVIPVGVCLFGESQVGKTSLSNEIHRRICNMAKIKHPDLFPDSANWTKWNAQSRDDYDQNYYGDEIAYEDDMFADRTDEGHQKYLAFISSGAVSTVQADLKSKGRPFTAKVVMVSCNNLPLKSASINNISALWNRFPITVECSIKEGSSKKTSRDKYDKDFKHLNFSVAPMTTFVRGSRQQSAGDVGATSVDLDTLVSMIVEEMALQQRKLDQTMQCYEEEHNPTIDHHDEIELQNVEPIAKELDISGMRSLFSKVKLAMDIDTESILHFREWAQHLKMKNTGQLWTEYVETPQPMCAYEFLVSLGIWEWIEGHEEIGAKALAQQPPVKVTCPYTTEYLFCPILTGNHLLIITDKVKELLMNTTFFEYILETKCRLFFEAAKNDMKWFKDLMYNFWRDYLGAPVVARITSIVLINNILGPRHVLAQYFLWVGFRLSSSHNLRVQTARIFNEGPSLIGTALRLRNYRNEFVHMLYKKIESFVETIKDTIYSLMLQLFDFIGIDITPYLDSFCSFVADVGHQTVCLAIVSMIIYAIYKLFCILSDSNKKKKMKTHNRVYEGRARRSATTKESRKKVRLHNDECSEECEANQTKMLDEQWEIFDEHCDFDKTDEWLQNVLTCVNTDAIVGYHAHYGCNDYFFSRPISWEGSEQKHEENRMMYYFFGENPINSDKVPMLSYTIKADLSGRTRLDLSMLKDLQVKDYYINAQIERRNDCIRACVDIYLLNGMWKEDRYLITRKQFSDVMSTIYQETKTKPKNWVKSVFEKTIEQHSSTEATDFLHRMRQDHVVKLACTSLVGADNVQAKGCYGIGHKNLIITVAHPFYKGNVLIKFWTENPNDYHIAKLIYTDIQGDRAFLKILSHKEVRNMSTSNVCINLSKMQKVFPSLEKHVFSHDEFITKCDDTPVLMWTHNQQVVMHTNMQFREPVYNECEDGIDRKVQYYALYGFKVDDSYKRDGECGSMIASAKVGMPPKWVGFYAASAGREHFCTTIWREQIQLAENYAKPQIVTHCKSVKEIDCMSQTDPWLDLIFPGKQIDSPTGGATDFVGKYCEVTKPISNSNLNHWRLSPFADNFEERVQPAPLSVNDERIVEPLPTNLEGKPSLLAVLNSTISQPIPENDDSLLEFCAKQIEDEYFTVLDIKDTPETINEVIELAINGREGNEYVTGIEINKAAGLPYATFGAQLKSDMIEIDSQTGKRRIKPNNFGKALKARVTYKLNRASKGVRVISFSNAKLKDAAIKLDYVKKGRGRIFHSIALDKIICDLGLFGNFKEAYTRAKLKVESALTLNTHSMGVVSIVEHLLKHKNFTDADFTNFDQRLARNLLLRVGDIQCNIIKKKNPRDVWDTARRILILEQVDTLVVEYQDITLTHRGNKSGEVKTTIDNNMARELADYYCWCKIILKERDLNLENIREITLERYRENRSAIGFGDDEVEAISDDIISEYNFETKKIELEKLGMVVTPGNKSKNIMKVTPFNELTFLKRKFVFQHGMWTMPLDVKSLEAPFVWTKIHDHDLDIWYELVKDRLYEALLHGEEYFDNFRRKLEKCSDSRLYKKIYPLIIQTYDTVLVQYKKNYYEH